VKENNPIKRMAKGIIALHRGEEGMVKGMNHAAEEVIKRVAPWTNGKNKSAVDERTRRVMQQREWQGNIKAKGVARRRGITQ